MPANKTLHYLSCGETARRPLTRVPGCRGHRETPAESALCPRGHGAMVEKTEPHHRPSRVPGGLVAEGPGRQRGHEWPYADLVTAWVTKYALSNKGIQRVEGSLSESGGIRFFRAKGSFLLNFLVGSEAFLSEEEALVDAEERRKKKILSLQKQLKKLKALRFEKEAL